MENMLQIENLKTHFFTRQGVVPAVDGVTLRIQKGQVVGVVGESGCGKSMMAMSIVRLLVHPGKIVEGEILLEGENLVTASEKKMREIRGGDISVIFQEPMTSLNPVLTVGKQVREAVLLHQKVSKQEAREKVIEMFRQVGIPESEERYKAYPHQLSGGLRQRVMIAMAMICNPKLLLADEPTTALDVTIEAQILHLMKQLQAQKGTAILLITHNLGVVAEICDYVYVMYAGKIVEQADVFTLFREPLHPYTNGLIRSIPKVHEKREQRERLYNISGMVPNLLYMPQGCAFCPRCEHAMERCKREKPALYDRGDGHKVRCFLYAPKQGGER